MRDAAPLYRAIADALEADVRGGRLTPGDPLPTQRELAQQLGVNFTTVTRAYAEARARGLITARVGSGTFVAAPLGPTHAASYVGATARADAAREDGDVDLSVNAPPVPAWMPDALRDAVTRAAADPVVVDGMLTYHARHGDVRARHAGAAWLRGRGLDASAERVIVTAGAQHALALLLGTLARSGETVLVESLSYPGMAGAAAAAGVRLVGVSIDAQGLVPDALDAACRATGARTLFCVPTLQNPTTAVMSLARRKAVLDVARRRGLHIVEDDICGPLLGDAPPPLAALAPERVTHVASLSKCVAPGLRTAYVLMPTTDDAARLAAGVRASILMLSPLSLAVATRWVEDGTAARAVADIAAEAAARGALARRLLGESHLHAPAGALHAWLRLPNAWTVAAFVAQAQQHGIRLSPADWYVVPDASGAPAPAPNAVRLTLGAAADAARLERALHALATMLRHPPALGAASL